MAVESRAAAAAVSAKASVASPAASTSYDSPWFRAPVELRPTPTSLLGQQRRIRRPPALAALEEPCKRAKAAQPRRPLPPLPLTPPDRAPSVAHGLPLRHGRVVLRDQLVVVPQIPADFEQPLEDPQRELLLVELVAPGGAWLNDPEVEAVLVSPDDAPSPRLVSIEAVRELVKARVTLLGRGAPTLRSLYQLTRPKTAPEYALVLVAVADLTPAEPAGGGASSPPAKPAAPP